MSSNYTIRSPVASKQVSELQCHPATWKAPYQGAAARFQGLSGSACGIIRRMALTENQLRFLRGKAHALKPLILIGQHGLTDGVCAETDRALTDHELIKVKVRGAERAARDALLCLLAERTGSELVQRIGHVATLYRARTPLPKLVLPDARPRAAV
jgi:RNA-binding protein